MAGAFEQTAKPIFHSGVPEGFNCAQNRLTEDWDQLRKIGLTICCVVLNVLVVILELSFYYLLKKLNSVVIL